jgi:hypothetical protein
MVRKQDLKAFKSLPISPAGPDISAYGKVLKDSDANFLFVRLLGRTITTDASGRTTVSW